MSIQGEDNFTLDKNSTYGKGKQKASQKIIHLKERDAVFMPNYCTSNYCTYCDTNSVIVRCVRMSNKLQKTRDSIANIRGKILGIIRKHEALNKNVKNLTTKFHSVEKRFDNLFFKLENRLSIVTKNCM